MSDYIEGGGPQAFDVQIEGAYSLESVHKQIGELSVRGQDYFVYKEFGHVMAQPYTLSDLGFSHAQRSEVEALVERARQHYAKLQEFGMSLVSHRIETRRSLLSTRTYGSNTVVAHMIKAFVPDSIDLASLTEDSAPPVQKINEFVVRPLRDYLEWSENSGAGYILADIYDARQYSWQQTSGVVFLHDISPHMEDTTADPATLAGHRDQAALIPYLE